jgi:ribosomal-protein-alanine N-acetyltransferase
MSPEYKIVLRPFVLSDSQSLAKHANNRLVSENLRDHFPFPYNEEDAIQFIQSVSKESPIKAYAIDINGQAIGAAGIVLKEDIYKGNGEIGYWIGQEYWGKGIVTFVVKELLRKAFDELKLYRVYAEVFEHNNASARVLEKNGFSKEATLSKAIIKNGVYQDLYIFSILNQNSRLLLQPSNRSI